MLAQRSWISIWTKPTQTISEIVVKNPHDSLWTLATIYGFCVLMSLYQFLALGTFFSFTPLLISAAVLAPFCGYLLFSLCSFLILVIGKLIGGEAKYVSIRSVFAWSCVPIAFNVVIWILMLFTFQEHLFLNFPDGYPLTVHEATFFFAMIGVKSIFSIWSFTIYLYGLVLIQKYSMSKAIINVVLATLILGTIPLFAWVYFMGI